MGGEHNGNRLVLQRTRQSHSERQPYGLLRDMLAAHFGIGESDTLVDVRRKAGNRHMIPSSPGRAPERGLRTGRA